MSFLDESDDFVDALSASDMDGIRALEEDRDDMGPGLTKAALEHVLGQRHLGGFFSRARAQGYRIGETPAGLLQLGHQEPRRAAA
jgi:hypothetical protein